MRVATIQFRCVGLLFSRCVRGRMLRGEWGWRGKGCRMNGWPSQVTRATHRPMRQPDRTCCRGAVHKIMRHAWSILSKLRRVQALLRSMTSKSLVILPHCKRRVLAPLASIYLVSCINIDLLTMAPSVAISLRHIMLAASCGRRKVSLVSTAPQSRIGVSYRPVMLECLLPISCLGAWRIWGLRIDLWDLIDLGCRRSSMHDHSRF